MASSYNELNLDKTLRKWAKAMHSSEDHSSKDHSSKGDAYIYKFNLNSLKFEDGTPNFKNTAQAQSGPTTQIIFEDTFRNDTPLTQKHRIRCERQTTSYAQVELQRAIVCDDRTRLRLSEMPHGIATKSGFLNEMDISRVKSHDFKEKLTWEVDDEIAVPPGSITRAEVIVTEHAQETSFEVKTRIRGNVHCDITDKNRENYKSVDGNIVTILQNYCSEEPGLTISGNSASFLSKGTCTFRYGISKNVNVYSDEN